MRTFFMTPLVVFLIMVMIMLAKLLENDVKKPSPLLGQKLPAFTLPAAYDGEPALLHTEFQGKYILLNIFGSWCITCRLEHPFLMQLKENNLLPIYGIAWNDKPEKLRNFLKNEGNPYSKIGTDVDGKTVIDLGVTGAPESFLISPDGTIVFAYSGPISQGIWESQIKPLIDGEKK